MKISSGKLLILIIITMAAGACNNPKYVRISGDIGNTKILSFYNVSSNSKNPMGRSAHTYIHIEAQQSGKINMKTDTIKEGYYLFLPINRLYYLRPGMHLVFANTKEGIKLTSHPYQNKLTALYDPAESLELIKEIDQLSFSEYCSKADQVLKKKKQYLNKIKDVRFKEIEQEHTKISVLMLKVTYLIYKPDFKITPDYLKLFNTIKFDKNYYSLFPEWSKWLTDYFNILSRIKKSRINEDLRLQLNFIKNMKTKKAWAWYQLQYPNSYNQETFDALSYAKSILNDKTQLASLDQSLQKIKRCLKGQPAYNFEFENESGDKVKLSSLKGSYVYIDCWGTHCRPCFVQMPYLKKIEEQFKDKNIKFVSICLSKKEKRWKELLKKFDLSGIKLIDHGSGEFRDFYHINYIPRYILIDKAGNLIDAYAMRPDNKELPAFLENLH